MTIILFLVDTSASMNQRTYLGARPTLLDVAKDAVEKFIKIRQRDSASRGDRYMLLTFEDPPSNIKAGWKESHATFMTELKNLLALGMTTLGAALKNALDLLNINRMQTMIDTYGQGRCPFYLEPSIIIIITDGGKLTSIHSVQDELNLPMHSSVPGFELTKEPFRWDQRLFALVLRLTGTHQIDRDPNTMVQTDCSPVNVMCEVTGGRSYAVTSQKTLVQCLESLVQKVQGGVVINFEKIGPDPPPMNSEGLENGDDKMNCQNHRLVGLNGALVPPPPTNTAWHSCRKLIYVQRSAQKGYSVGHWPIPESFWPDVNSPSLPARTAHPVVKFTCANSEPMVIDNLPFDKYELEPSPLTQYILSRKQPTVAWQVFVSNSHRNSEIGLPFGYMKASTSLTCVNLFVMPYNYPVLLPLLDQLFKVHRGKPTREWRQQFDDYLNNMPRYYAGPLKRAMQRMGAPNLIPDSMENCLSYTVLNYLKRLKNQAKAEFDKLLSSVGTGKPLIPEGIRIASTSARHNFSGTTKLTEMTLISNPSLVERFSSIRSELNDFTGFMLSVRDKEVKTESYRNPFDIPRKCLLDQIARLRANYLQPFVVQTRLQDEDQLHSLLVSQMGNYQEYLKRMPTPLREIESNPVRQHMFGNPFKIEKRMMVDEADIDLVGGGGQTRVSKRQLTETCVNGAPRPKRRPGPLPKDFPVRRPQSPVPVESPPLVNGQSPGPPPLDDQVNDKMPPVPEVNSIPPVLDQVDDWSNPPDGMIEVTPVNHISNKVTANHIGDWNSDTAEVVTNCVEKKDFLLKPLLNRNDHMQIRQNLFKEVRRPGRNFTRLFEQLQSLPGTDDTRLSLVQEVIDEASRFKRKHLISLLEDFLQHMVEVKSAADSVR